MIAISVAFLLTLLWYFFDNRTNTVQHVSPRIEHYQGVIRREDIDAYKRKFSIEHPDEVLPQKPIGRLYYSIPGKTYTCFIQEGRVLKAGKTWPYPPNKP